MGIKQTAIRFKRIPVMNRTAIYQRVAQGSVPIEYSSCKLCKSYDDCSGYIYAEPEQSLVLNAPNIHHRKIYIPKYFEDWDGLKMTLRALNLLHVNVRVITDIELPTDIIWALSYSTFNIVQVNVDMVDNKDLGWIGNTFALTDKCGVYSILFLYPLIPTITKTYHVIELIDNFKNLCNHVSLKFIDLPDLEVKENHLNFYGTAVPVKYLQKTKTGYSCNEAYIKKFMEIIKSYTTPRKISISVCNYGEDCTGLGLEG